MFGDIINEKPNKPPCDIPKSVCQACDLHLLQEDLKEVDLKEITYLIVLTLSSFFTSAHDI